jgi:hypothetical protein
VFVPTVLPQTAVRAVVVYSEYPIVALAGPVIKRFVTVAPVPVPALKPIL